LPGRWPACIERDRPLAPPFERGAPSFERADLLGARVAMISTVPTY
jgi:hypothetical protein